MKGTAMKPSLNAPFAAAKPAAGASRRIWLTRSLQAGVSAGLAGMGLKAAAQSAPPTSAAGSPPRGPGGPERGSFMERMWGRLLEGLDLSAEQRSRLQALAQRAQQEMSTGSEPRRALREKALAEWAKPQLDMPAIEALRLEQVKLHDEGSRRMTALITEAAAVLSPAQRAQVVQRMQQMPPRGMGGGMGRGG